MIPECLPAQIWQSLKAIAIHRFPPLAIGTEMLQRTFIPTPSLIHYPLVAQQLHRAKGFQSSLLASIKIPLFHLMSFEDIALM
jgi:hypothetical protein